MPPQTNATIVRVRGAGAGGGPAGDFGHEEGAGGPGPEKWAGSVRAYYRELNREQAGDRRDVFLRRELIIDVADVDAMDLDTDDTLTWTVDGQAGEHEGTPSEIPRPRLAGVPRDVQTSKVILQDA